MRIQTLLAEVGRAYGLKGVALVRKVTVGALSNNYVIASGGRRYFLKHYRAKVKDRIVGIHVAKHFFSTGGIPVILPLPTQAGSTYFLYEDQAYALFPYVVGKQVHAAGSVSLPQAQSLGSTLAKMHYLSSEKLPRIPAPRLPAWTAAHGRELQLRLEETTQRILKVIARKRVKNQFDRRAQKLLELKVQLASHNPRRFNVQTLGKPHATHGDYHIGNVFFNAQGEVSHVFDFEKFELYPRSLELFRSLYISCFNGRFTVENFKKAKAYMRAYNAMYPIRREEFAQAVRYSAYRHIYSTWVEAEHYLHHNTRTDKFLLGDWLSVQYFSEHLETFIEKVW